MKKPFILGVFTVLVVSVLFFGKAFAKQDDKVLWCHTEPNGNQQTLNLPLQALQQAGHVDANGNPLHAGDHAGACITPTATPTVSPTASPTPSVSPSPTVSPTGTPSATPSPTDTPKTNTNSGNGGDDPNSCVHKDCNTHPATPTPTPNYPSCNVPNTCGWK